MFGFEFFAPGVAVGLEFGEGGVGGEFFGRAEFFGGGGVGVAVYGAAALSGHAGEWGGAGVGARFAARRG